jgi:hypothetical protein
LNRRLTFSFVGPLHEALAVPVQEPGAPPRGKGISQGKGDRAQSQPDGGLCEEGGGFIRRLPVARGVDRLGKASQ